MPLVSSKSTCLPSSVNFTLMAAVSGNPISRITVSHIIYEVHLRDFAESQSKDFSEEEIDDEESAEECGYLSDSGLEDKENEKADPPKYTSRSRVHPSNPFDVQYRRR